MPWRRASSSTTRGPRRPSASPTTWSARPSIGICPETSGSTPTPGSPPRSAGQRGRGGVADIARHRIRAAVDDASRRVAVGACVAAAEAARRGLDHGEAVHWYGRALELAPGDVELLLGRADAAYRDGRLDVALADSRAAVDAGDPRGAYVVRGLGGPIARPLQR